MRKLRTLVVGAAVAALCSVAAWAGAPSVPMMMMSAAPPPPPQVIAKISPSSCSFVMGTAANCAVSVTMSPSTPSFSADGGVISLVSSNSACPGTNDTADFVVNNSPYQIVYNGSTAAGNYNTCVQASATGVAPGYQQVAITITNPVGGPPTPPAFATNAGFTTVAMNTDFTGATQSSLAGTVYDVSNKANFLSCAGAANPIWYTVQNGSTDPPCSAYNITTDPVYGQKVLDMSYAQSDFLNGEGWTLITSQNGQDLSGTLYPVTGVREVVFRDNLPASQFFTPSSVCINQTGTQHCPSGGSWWSFQSICCAGVEIDFWELWYPFDSTNNAVIDWSNNNAGGPTSPETWSDVAGYDATQYHTYDTRITGDGSGNNATCQWLDGVSLGCSQYYSGFFTAPWYTQQDNLLLGTGPYWTDSISGVVNTQHRYVQRITDYECSAWQSGYCWGTVLGDCAVGQTTPC